MDDLQPTAVQVLLCRCSHAQSVTRAAALALESRLCSAGSRVVTTPDLCGMAARRDPRLAEIAASGPVHVVACHERAVRWLLDWAGMGGARIRPWPSPDGFTGYLALPRWRAAGGDRVEAAVQDAGRNNKARVDTDMGLSGSKRGGGGASGHL